MEQHKISIFASGVHNLLDNEDIPTEAIQDEKNWFHQDGKIRLVNGKYLIGAEGVAGEIEGLHVGYKHDGTPVLFRKISTKIQYWNTTTELWTDIILGLTDGKEYSFANYTSLAGDFVYACGYDGLFKIHTANLDDYTTLTSATANDKGRIFIDKGRMLMWNCSIASKTTLRLSHIDDQDAAYTTETAEATASLTGTLAFKAGSSLRTCFNTVFTLTGTGEIYTDNKDGTLTGSLGGTGTINYTTGEYTLSNAGVGTCTYQWENSNSNGITDFTYSSPRVASEGNIILQSIGGDAIENVLIGQDGKYYSLKSHSVYELNIADDDETFTNLVFRSDIGIPYWRAAISTMQGIVFMDTAREERPQLKILQRNIVSGDVEPVILFPQFDFSKYSYSDCAIDSWDKYVVIACRDSTSDENNVILIGNLQENTIDISYYPARMFAKHTGDLYIGDPFTESVYKVFNGFDDDGYSIENFCTLKSEHYNTENLKKFRKLRIQGQIVPDQNVDVYISYDGADFEKIGTIEGSGGYVDAGTPRTIGSNMVGEIPIGGDNATTVYPYFYEVKVHPPKFRKRAIRFIATAIGYVDVGMVMDDNILLFENRIPKRFRVKKI